MYIIIIDAALTWLSAISSEPVLLIGNLASGPGCQFLTLPPLILTPIHTTHNIPGDQRPRYTIA